MKSKLQIFIQNTIDENDFSITVDKLVIRQLDKLGVRQVVCKNPFDIEKWLKRLSVMFNVKISLITNELYLKNDNLQVKFADAKSLKELRKK